VAQTKQQSVVIIIVACYSSFFYFFVDCCTYVWRIKLAIVSFLVHAVYNSLLGIHHIISYHVIIPLQYYMQLNGMPCHIRVSTVIHALHGGPN